jgi:hypothetical protein
MKLSVTILILVLLVTAFIVVKEIRQKDPTIPTYTIQEPTPYTPPSQPSQDFINNDNAKM